MTEPVTSLNLSLKLKEAGAPQDREKPHGKLFWECHANCLESEMDTLPYSEGNRIARYPVELGGSIRQGNYTWRARAYTVGELIAMAHTLGYLVEISARYNEITPFESSFEAHTVSIKRLGGVGPQPSYAPRGRGLDLVKPLAGCLLWALDQQRNQAPPHGTKYPLAPAEDVR